MLRKGHEAVTEHTTQTTIEGTPTYVVELAQGIALENSPLQTIKEYIAIGLPEDTNMGIGRDNHDHSRICKDETTLSRATSHTTQLGEISCSCERWRT